MSTLPACAADVVARWRHRAAEAARRAAHARPDVAGYADGFHAGESSAYESAAAELPQLVEQLVEQLARPPRPQADDGEE